jgi:hypothetical protein
VFGTINLTGAAYSTTKVLSKWSWHLILRGSSVQYTAISKAAVGMAQFASFVGYIASDLLGTSPRWPSEQHCGGLCRGMHENAMKDKMTQTARVRRMEERLSGSQVQLYVQQSRTNGYQSPPKQGSAPSQFRNPSIPPTNLAKQCRPGCVEPKKEGNFDGLIPTAQ